MKRRIQLWLTVTLLAVTGLLQAQVSEDVRVRNYDANNSWHQNRPGIYTLSVGGTQQIFVGPYGGLTWPGMALNVEGEYGLGTRHIVGMGWNTGMNFYFYPSNTILQVPVGLLVNVHILAAANKTVRGLDVYAGGNLGGGPGFILGNGPRFPDEFPERPRRVRVTGLLYGGPQFGVRYWFSNRAAINAQIGWGQSFTRIGFTF